MNLPVDGFVPYHHPHFPHVEPLNALRQHPVRQIQEVLVRERFHILDGFEIYPGHFPAQSQELQTTSRHFLTLDDEEYEGQDGIALSYFYSIACVYIALFLLTCKSLLTYFLTSSGDIDPIH